ncbi:MAG: glycosyltransferase family 4 protein [Clostridia bacterium]|nr:glycosyltransferase family 4 protein [Clostridia bacterium]
MAARWRVVLPVLSLHLGGGTRLLAEVANGLARQGHAVTVVIPGGSPIAYPLYPPVQVVRAPYLDPPHLPPADVILPNFFATVPAVTRAPARLRLRLSLGFEPLWVADRETALATYHLPWPLVCISSWLRETIRQATGREAAVIHPGVDPSVFRPEPGPAQAAPTVFYIARSAAQGYFFKGGADFWQAMAAVRQRRPDLEVVVVAPEGSVDGASVPYRLAVAPGDAEMAELYRRCRVFVSSSWFEGFNLPVLEAMACGAAVVTTDCGGIRDFVRPGENALVVPPRDPGALAAAVLRLLDDPDLCLRLGRAAARSAQGWTWRRTVSELEAVIASHLG